MIIDEFIEYTYIYFELDKLAIKSIFQMFDNLVEIQFLAKIKKLKSKNRCDYRNNEMTAFLASMRITYDLSLRDTYKRIINTCQTLLRSHKIF
jgi:hypothetical protein